MPYALTLQQYCKPEFFAEPPASWEQRLREISPVRPDTSHLVFRKFDFHPSWVEGRPSEFTWEPRPIWALYSAMPRPMAHPERAVQFERHWSELDPTQQVGRKAVVSDYQHFMWHTRGLYVEIFWILQGQGGTPAKYSDRERRYLDASGAVSTPIPLGYLPACPFDERAVKLILERDRLVKAGNRLDELEKMDLPIAKRLEQEEAERVYRETYLDTIREMNRPSVEFMRSYLRKSESVMALPDAPDGLADTLAQWRDVFKETGQMMGVGMPTSRAVQVAVL